jgi:hypothetical protein
LGHPVVGKQSKKISYAQRKQRTLFNASKISVFIAARKSAKQRERAGNIVAIEQ